MPGALPKLGIIAGGGPLPRRIAEACKDQGREHFILAIKDHADPAMLAESPHAWVRLGNAEKGISLLREAGVKDLILAGPVKRPSLAQLRPDRRALGFFTKIGLKSLGDDGLLGAVIGELEKEGFNVVGLEAILPDLLAPLGQLGAHAPDDQARADIERGIEVARGIGALDVGQGCVVQQGIVLAVEAAEGTDSMLERSASLIREGPGGVLVKLTKPDQETRADLPTIGPRTVAAAARAGLRGIAIEAGHSLIVDRAQVIAKADDLGLFVVGVTP